ncbi:MAG: hypothetical protein KAH32_00105 [Chlamydiia bacterium]|nr:hypothetical protein [Chlamydiia bacterium]
MKIRLLARLRAKHKIVFVALNDDGKNVYSVAPLDARLEYMPISAMKYHTTSVSQAVIKQRELMLKSAEEYKKSSVLYRYML